MRATYGLAEAASTLDAGNFKLQLLLKGSSEGKKAVLQRLRPCIIIERTRDFSCDYRKFSLVINDCSPIRGSTGRPPQRSRQRKRQRKRQMPQFIMEWLSEPEFQSLPENEPFAPLMSC